MKTISAKPCIPGHCQHCGEWHYGRGFDHETAQRNLDRLIAECKRRRTLAGLADAEMTPLKELVRSLSK